MEHVITLDEDKFEELKDGTPVEGEEDGPREERVIVRPPCSKSDHSWEYKVANQDDDMVTLRRECDKCDRVEEATFYWSELSWEEVGCP